MPCTEVKYNSTDSFMENDEIGDQPDKKIVPLLDKSIKSFSILPEK
jgi:hypothetical protein